MQKKAPSSLTLTGYRSEPHSLQLLESFHLEVSGFPPLPHLGTQPPYP